MLTFRRNPLEVTAVADTAPTQLPGRITLVDVDYAVDGKTILKGITADLGERRIGIVGRNGSGKSTLLRLMAGLIAPGRGEIRVAGLDPVHDRKAMLSSLGILFQNPDHQILFPTVEEELSFGLLQQGRSKAEAREAVMHLLADDNRAHWAKAHTSVLSQGQRQYLNLLSILLMRPQTILLDEPFAGLDLPTQTRLTRRLSALPQRLITVTHDPASVADCERVLWLEGGRIYRDGPARDVTAEFRSRMIALGGQDADTDLSQ
jgi:biotin transport system ATP-binding protein